MSVPDIDYFAMIYLGAKHLEKEKRRPGGKPEDLDFGCKYMCTTCNKPITANKPLACSACKAFTYCSKAVGQISLTDGYPWLMAKVQCHTQDWKFGKMGAPSHKELCASNKIHMEKVSMVREIINQFPWGRVEKDGSFHVDMARASFHVLGGKGYGYWSEQGGFVPHLANPTSLPGLDKPQVPWMDAIKTDTTYQHGYLLLRSSHLDEKEGWKLEPRFIPRLTLDEKTMPVIASQANVVDWDSWYKWRKIPKESPAALLMHYPLSIYQLLVHVLHLVHPKRDPATGRQQITVHYLGAEVELNMIPLFSELALLLPYTDIDIVFFGVAVRDIVSVAKKGHPKSLVMKAISSDGPVYEYTSPAALGSSTFRARLYGDSEYWDPSVLSSTLLPDALVAANAGLLSYPAWSRVIQWCHATDVPFAVTEYAEQSAEIQRGSFPMMVSAMTENPGVLFFLSSKERENLVKKRTYPIAFNPFQRPGQRQVMYTRVPNVPNGFTLRVVGRDENPDHPKTSTETDELDITRKAEELKIHT